MTAPEVMPLDPRAYALLAEAGFGDDLFNPRQHRCGVLLDLYTHHLAGALVARLGVTALLDRPRSVDELIAALGFVPGFRAPLAWLLAYLATGRTPPTGPPAHHRLPGPPPVPTLESLRTEALALDPGYAAAYALLDEAAAIYPRVARGETSGERALFLRAALWAAYFSNTNGAYAFNNQVAARVAVR